MGSLKTFLTYNHPECDEGEIFLFNVYTPSKQDGFRYPYEDKNVFKNLFWQSKRKGKKAYRSDKIEIIPDMKPVFISKKEMEDRGYVITITNRFPITIK